VLEIVGAALNLPIPTLTWFASRLWLLRLGYYKLIWPKVIADDGVWIIDHTVQIGKDNFWLCWSFVCVICRLPGAASATPTLKPSSCYR